jgi:hypothetical protein
MAGARSTIVALIAVIAWGVNSAGASPATPDENLAVVHVYAPRSGPGANCARVYPLKRTVRKPAVLTGAMRALLAGPTAAERARGYGGWFSGKTANKLHAVHIGRGVAYVDFHDFRRVIPNASSSCGSALLLAELNTTATQFPSVRRAVYSFNGDRRGFYEWLQRDAPRAGSD